MNYIDYIIIILVVIAAVRGAVKGLIYEVASLLALIGGIWGAIKFSSATETYLVKRFDFTNEHIDIIAFVITFVLIIIIIHLIGKAVEKLMESVSLGGINRILGLVFGVLKTLVILGIVVVVIEKIDEELPFVPEDHIKESKFYDPLKNVALNTFPFIQEFYKNIKEKAEEIKESEILERATDEKRRSET